MRPARLGGCGVCVGGEGGESGARTHPALLIPLYFFFEIHSWLIYYRWQEITCSCDCAVVRLLMRGQLIVTWVKNRFQWELKRREYVCVLTLEIQRNIFRNSLSHTISHIFLSKLTLTSIWIFGAANRQVLARSLLVAAHAQYYGYWRSCFWAANLTGPGRSLPSSFPELLVFFSLRRKWVALVAKSNFFIGW